ncbi:MAG: aspartate/glutamate racemase family protein [Pseudomonadota bacterium]
MTYMLDAPAQTQLGLIVLSTDETLELEARQLLAGRELQLFHSRIFSANAVTQGSLRDMEKRLSETAALLPEGVKVIGYGCTSASVMIGSDGVERQVHAGKPDVAVTNPMRAVTAALEHLGARRIAMLTPYTKTVADPMRAHLSEQDIEIVRSFDFGEEDDRRVARISEASTREAVQKLVADGGVDAVFASCTNLRTFGVIDAIEAETGLPMLSSNQALLWHMLQLAGQDASNWGPGRLFGNTIHV